MGIVAHYANAVTAILKQPLYKQNAKAEDIVKCVYILPYHAFLSLYWLNFSQLIRSCLDFQYFYKVCGVQNKSSHWLIKSQKTNNSRRHQFTNPLTSKLTNSSTQKLINSQTHQLKTLNCYLLFYNLALIFAPFQRKYRP